MTYLITLTVCACIGFLVYKITNRKQEEAKPLPISYVAKYVSNEINKSTTFYRLCNAIELRDKMLLHRQDDPGYTVAMEMIAQLIQIKEIELLVYTEKQAENLRDHYRHKMGLPVSSKKK